MMQYPWTVLLETQNGNVEAQQVLASSNAPEAITQAKSEFPGFRVLGIVKGSHASVVYGHQVERQAANKNQLRIPFGQEGHEN